MGWQLTPYTVLLVVTAAVSLAVSVPVFRNRHQQGAAPLTLFLLAASVQCVGAALRFSTTTLDIKLFWLNVEALGATIVPALHILLAAAFTDRGQWLTRKRVLGLFGLEGLLMFLSLTNPYNLVVSSETALVTVDSYTYLKPVFGPIFYLNATIQYVFFVVAAFWLVKKYWQSRRSRNSVYARQVGLLVLAMFFPWVGNVMFVLGLTPVDLSPFGYAATGLLVATAVFRYRLLDILPIARGTVVESMDNAVFVLDTKDTVVDVNPRAEEIIGVDEDDLIGAQFDDVFAEFPPIQEKFGAVRETRDQVSICRDGSEYHYEVTVSPIADSLDNYVGRTFVFGDITIQVEREQQLRAREQDLDLMRQVLSRVLRHNIRNQLQLVRGNNEILADQLDGDQQEIAEAAVSMVDDLVALSDKARGVEMLVEQDQTAKPLDLGGTLRRIVEQSRDEFPNVSFTLEGPTECVVETTPSFDLVFENLIENAAEHNTASEPTVGVTISQTTDGTRVTISDNGPGIPSQELSVLEQGKETDLEHGSGLGLWVVNWVLTDSSASIRYDTGADGTEVAIHIPS